MEIDIFEKLEKFSKNKIPECIKSILKFAAFDTACSLSSLDEAAISSIENYVDQSEKSIINQLVCCNADKYQGQSHFHFLPGHRTILRSIPELIKQMKQSKKKPYKKLSDFQKLLSPQELKDLLLNRLNQHNFAKQGGLFTETHIEQITTMISNNTMSAKCDVKCLSCEASVPIVYNGSWGTSNVFRHLKAHYKNSGKGKSLFKYIFLVYQHGVINVLMKCSSRYRQTTRCSKQNQYSRINQFYKCSRNNQLSCTNGFNQRSSNHEFSSHKFKKHIT